MSEDQRYFLYTIALLNPLFLAFHAFRTQITLGAFFGVAGVFALMLWQVLQTGWWVDIGNLHFNAGLAIFVPILLWGSQLTLMLDGLKTARAFILMVLIAGLASWAFSEFRESLSRYIPLPYLMQLGSREHLAIILSVFLAQYGAMITLNRLRRWLQQYEWLALPLSIGLASQLWLVAYSFLRYPAASAFANLRNESIEFMLATLPCILLGLPYLQHARHHQRLMPVLDDRTIVQGKAQDLSEDELINRDRTISELEQLNRQLQENARLMNYHLDHASYGILISDAHGRCRRSNAAARQLFGQLAIGCKLSEELGRYLGQLPPLLQLANTAESLRCKYQSLDGAPPRWLEIRVTLLQSHQRGAAEGYYILIQDVTESILAETRRLQSARIKDIHTTGRVLAHDFSNVFVGARAQLERLRRDPDNAEPIEALNTALRHAQSMLGQLGSGNQFGTPRLQRIALASLIGDTVAICAAATDTAGIRLIVTPMPTCHLEVDPSQIVRVLTNLLRNALRASPAGSSIELAAHPHANGVRITVSDQGHGIPPDQLAKVFDPGYTSREEGQGGLGLAISYLMIDAHGGHLELIPNPEGAGIQARVWLPLPHHQASVLDDIPAHSRVLLLRPDDMGHARLVHQLEETCQCIVADLRTQEELHAILEDDPAWDYLLFTTDYTPSGLPDRVRQICLDDSCLV